MLEVKEIRYTRTMILCNYCGKRLLARGSFSDWRRAEEWAKEKGWCCVPITPSSDLLTGGEHYCPSCLELPEVRP